MVGYDFTCMEGDTIGFTNMHFKKNDASETNATGITVKLYSATSRYPSTYTEIGSGTTNNQGKVNLTGTISSSGGYYLFYGAGEQKEYLASVLVQKPVSSITLASNKNVLSYADSDSCTLTATLKDSDGETVTVDGETVTFYKILPTHTYSNKTIPATTETSLVTRNMDEMSRLEFTLNGIGGRAFILNWQGLDEGTYTTQLLNVSEGSRVSIRYSNSVCEVYVNDVLKDTVVLSSSVVVSTVMLSCEAGVEVVVSDFVYKSPSVVGTGSTTSGVATCTYNSSGVGEVLFYAVCDGIISTETYVTDAKYYDASSSSNVSKYTKNGNGTISYDATNTAYLLNNGSSNWKMYSFSLDSLNIPYNAVLKAKVKLISSFNCQCGLGLVNGNNGLSGKICVSTDSSTYVMSVIEPTKTSYGSNEVVNQLSSSTMQVNVWYDLEVNYEGNTITFKLYNAGTLVGTATTTSNVLSASNNNLAFWIGMYGNSQANIKDIMVL